MFDMAISIFRQNLKFILMISFQAEMQYHTGSKYVWQKRQHIWLRNAVATVRPSLLLTDIIWRHQTTWQKRIGDNIGISSGRTHMQTFINVSSVVSCESRYMNTHIHNTPSARPRFPVYSPALSQIETECNKQKTGALMGKEKQTTLL